MIRFTRYWIVLISLLLTISSCVDENQPFIGTPSIGGNTVSISGRISAFDNHFVESRAGKTPDESYTSSMAMAIFPIENGSVRECISYIHLQGSNVNFTVDRAKLRETYGDIYDKKSFAIYLFANMPELPANMAGLTDKSLSFFLNKAYGNSSIRRPQKGFPMVGSLGDNITEGADGNTFVLIPTETVDGNTKIKLPELNGIPSDYIPIPLKALYAKFSFDISIQPEQHIPDGTTPTFTLESYELNNVPTKVYAGAENNNNHTSVSGSAITTHVGTSVTEGGSLKFDFYLPERFVELKQFARDFKYPLGENGTKVNESEVHGNNRRYLQRFKPKLVTDDQMATYITLNGYYLDHQNHNWKVSYDIYLGEDNYRDFNFKRNTNYVNNVVIRGLKASKDQNGTDSVYVFVDHRVTIDRSLPLIINLQRETLLDAHYEVRPLRLRSVGENIPLYNSATVKILNKDGGTSSIPGWVRLEKSGATGNHITSSGPSKGKRRYFTTDLVTNTLADSISVTVSNLTRDNQTVWIYADENPSTASREAIVRVIYNDSDNSDSLDYKIVQHGLHEITRTSTESGNNYFIEQFEEYLYNFDAEDSYGQIKEEGMPWGLNNVQLSNKYDSFTCNETNDDWKNYIKANPLKYDFYIGKHDDDNENSDVYTKDGGTLHNFAGQEFTENIVKNSNAGIEYRTMADSVRSAVEYCYNKNKRNPDGTVDVKWYLPSADELEDFIVPAYSTFKEFQDNYYWTSQPAYIRNAFYYEYRTTRKNAIFPGKARDTYVFVTYEDNKAYARATKVGYNNIGGTYDYVPSGLNKTPAEPHNMDAGCINAGEIDTDNFFYVAHAWYRYSNTTDAKTLEEDTHFDERRDGQGTNNRYHIHLGHLNDLIQKTANNEHGYHLRTKSNRVRCVYKK